MAEYWANSLTAADRTAWDTSGFASNGFESFMQQNLCAYSLSPGLTEPIIGQNLGDTTDPSQWVFVPPVPLFNPLGFLPTKAAMTLTFTGATRYTLTDLTASTAASARAESATMYSTRPYDHVYNSRDNPLVRIGKFVAGASGSVFFFTDNMETTTAPLKTLWERVIGGARSGQKIRCAVRFSARRSPVSYVGALHGPTIYTIL
jgi:hypothetical protein